MRVASEALAAVLAVVGTAAFVSAPLEPAAPASSTHATGPPAAHTGGFGEPTCAECHIGYPVNAPGGMVSVRGLPQAYRPGAEYRLTVMLQSEEMGAAGFELAARIAGGERAGTSAGTLRPVDSRVAVTDSMGVAYAHQTPAGSQVTDPDLATWTVSWTAPRAGTVAVHVAANSANGDQSPLSDLVYTAESTLAPEGPPR